VPKILVVEDDEVISRIIKAYLVKANFQVEQAYNGDDAIEKFDSCNPDLVLLDVMLPVKDGWSVLQYIRSKSPCPVIMLTALGQIQHKLEGLHQGADDYITKPFVGEEVVARVEAVLRRPAQILDGKETKYFGSLKIDFKAHAVYLHGIEIPLIPRDLALLLFMARHPNQTFTREQLIENVWGIDYEGSDRAVDLAIKRIRQSLKNWPQTEGEVKTLRGVGYQFSVYEK